MLEPQGAAKLCPVDRLHGAEDAILQRLWSAGAFVEVHPPWLEPLAGGMRPGAGGNAQITSGGVEPCAGQDGPTGGIEGSTSLIGEMDPVGIVGNPLYSELAEMVEPMMSMAEGDEVLRV